MQSRKNRLTDRLTRAPLLRSVLLPWTMTLIVFFPVLQGRIPLNLDWLAAHHYPWKSIASGEVHNPDIDDPVLEFYPLAHRAAEVLDRGEIPLWNPDIGCGIPQLADFISQPLDPLFLISLLLTASFPAAWSLLLLLQQLILAASVAGFLLARRCSVTGAMIGSTAVLFSAPVVNWMELRRLNACFICLFLAFWAIERYLKRPILQVFLTGSALAFGGLAGHPQFTLYVWLLSAAYFLYRTTPDRKLMRSLWHLVLIVVFAGALCSPVVIPQMELLQNATRGEPGRYFSMFRFGAAPWLSLLIPDILGHPATRDYFGEYIYFRSYTTLPVLYFGALPMTAIFMLIRRRIPGKLFFCGFALALLCLLTLAAIKPVRLYLNLNFTGFFNIDPGRSAILAGIILAAWSGEAASRVISSGPVNGKQRLFGALTPFLAVTAAATSLSMMLLVFQETFERIVKDNSFLLYLLKLQQENEALLNAPSVRRMLLVFALATLALLLARTAGINKTMTAVAIALVLCVDLLPWAIRFNPFITPDRIELPAEHRTIMEQHRNSGYRSVGLDRSDSTRPESEIFSPNSLLLFGIPDFRQYSSTPLAFGTELIRHVQKGRYWDRTIKLPLKPLLDLASVKYFYTMPQYDPRPEDLTLSEHLAGMNVYVSNGVFPRLRLTGWHRSAVRPEKVGIDPVIRDIWDWLEENPERFIGSTFLSGVKDDHLLSGIAEAAFGEISSVSWSDHQIEVIVETGAPALAVLGDSWYPGWTATVNGKATDVLRANGMFRAVAVPAGRSTLVMRYQPVSYRLGLFLMMLALFAAGVTGACYRKQGVRE